MGVGERTRGPGSLKDRRESDRETEGERCAGRGRKCCRASGAVIRTLAFAQSEKGWGCGGLAAICFNSVVKGPLWLL